MNFKLVDSSFKIKFYIACLIYINKAEHGIKFYFTLYMKYDEL